MFNILQTAGAAPMSFICDPSAEFEPGYIGELVTIGNQVMLTVSNGTAPIGIIDDIKTKSFTNVSWNEDVIVPVESTAIVNNQLVSVIDIKKELDNPHIISSSFSSTIDVVLNSKNGIVTFLAGTPLNFDMTGSGTPDAIRAVVNYTYRVPNIPGDDTTIGSNRVSVWYNRMFFQTTVFETNQEYQVRTNLFVSEKGILTSRRPSKFHPAVAMVTAPPTAMVPTLEALWF